MCGQKEYFFLNFKPDGACIYMPRFFETTNVFGSHIRLNNSARTAGIETHKYVA